MDATTLAEHSDFLNLAVVRSRASDDTDAIQLGAAAESLLRDAIAAIQPRNQRLVAEAALVADSMYDDMDVTERKETLAREYGISIDTYRRLRPVVYRKLTRWILSQERAAGFGITGEASIQLQKLSEASGRLFAYLLVLQAMYLDAVSVGLPFVNMLKEGTSYRAS